MKLSHVTFVWLAILCVMSQSQIKAVHYVDFTVQQESPSKVLGVKLDSVTTLEQFKESNKESLEADLKVGKMLGWVDLHLAALWGLADEIKRLIKEENFDVNVKDSIGQTPLHLAAARGKTASIQVLLKYWADPNAQDKHDWTPLHVAYFHMHSVNHPSIKLLKDGWALTTIKNDAGRTPLEIRSLVNEHSWR